MPQSIPPPRSVRLRESDISVHRNIERLVEMRLCRVEGGGAFAELQRVLLECLDDIGEPAVLCADLRHVRVLSPSAGQELTQLMRSPDPRLLRSVALVSPDDAAFGLLAQRMVRGAGCSEREIFTTSDETLAWLGQELSDSELTRARHFLLEGEEPPLSIACPAG